LRLHANRTCHANILCEEELIWASQQRSALVKSTELHWSALTFWNAESQNILGLLLVMSFGDT